MNINLFTQRFSPLQNLNKSNSQNNNYYTPTIKNNKLAPLKADTVSFTAAKFVLKPRVFGDALEDQFTLEGPRLKAIGRVFHAVSKDIADGSNGIFKISDNIEHLVKDPKTRVKKIIRSGEMKVHDILRLTAYCKDPYNFDSLLYFIREMEVCRYILDKVPIEMSKLIKRGYIPTEEENMIMAHLANPKDKEIKKQIMPYFKEKGYYTEEIKELIDELKHLDHMPSHDEFYELFEKVSKKIPDLDIRLSSKLVTPEQIKKLPEEYRYCITKPQSSGYEDIQMRFVRSYVKEKENQIPHEMIILFGENYQNAKTRESHYVYSNLRKFKELGVRRFFDNEKFDSETAKVKLYIELIENMFRNNISKNEFTNAKNKDYLGEKKEIEIKFSDNDFVLLKGYIEGLLKEIGKPYTKAINKQSKNKRKPLEDAKKADKLKIREIHESLKETIEAYNSGKAYELTNPKPKAKRAKKKDINTEA